MGFSTVSWHLVESSMQKKRTNPCKEANEAFLAEKAKEEGIVVLGNGVIHTPGFITHRPSSLIRNFFVS